MKHVTTYDHPRYLIKGILFAALSMVCFSLPTLVQADDRPSDHKTYLTVQTPILQLPLLNKNVVSAPITMLDLTFGKKLGQKIYGEITLKSMIIANSVEVGAR